MCKRNTHDDLFVMVLHSVKGTLKRGKGTVWYPESFRGAIWKQGYYKYVVFAFDELSNEFFNIEGIIFYIHNKSCFDRILWTLFGRMRLKQLLSFGVWVIKNRM